MIKAVVFDFGGVVHTLENVFSGEEIAHAYRLTLDEIKPTLTPLMEKMSIGKISEFEFWHKLSAQLRKPVPRNYFNLLRSNLRNHAKLHPEIAKLVEKLKKKNIKTVVLSNTIPPHAEVLKQKGWYQLFDSVFLSYKLGLRKPNIEIFQWVLDHLRLKGNKCIYVDDLKENLRAAQKLKMKCLLAIEPQQVVNDIERLLTRNSHITSTPRK